jgi:hypothetical protein
MAFLYLCRNILRQMIFFLFLLAQCLPKKPAYTGAVWEVGLRGRYNFSKAFYTSVRREVGGLSVGSDLMWQVEASVGCNITRNIFTEVGYRALSFWYENDGLSFDTITHGPQITAGIRF